VKFPCIFVSQCDTISPSKSGRLLYYKVENKITVFLYYTDQYKAKMLYITPDANYSITIAKRLQREFPCQIDWNRSF
jgi:hypothetical protein